MQLAYKVHTENSLKHILFWNDKQTAYKVHTHILLTYEVHTKYIQSTYKVHTVECKGLYFVCTFPYKMLTVKPKGMHFVCFFSHNFHTKYIFPHEIDTQSTYNVHSPYVIDIQSAYKVHTPICNCTHTVRIKYISPYAPHYQTVSSKPAKCNPGLIPRAGTGATQRRMPDW